MRAFLLALEVNPMQVSKTYNQLDLHCTVVHWFRTKATSHDVLAVVMPIINKAPAIELVSDKTALFGPSKGLKDIPVNLVKPTSAFRTLHSSLLQAIEQLGVRHTEPAYTGKGFNSHVTKQGNLSFSEGSRHVATITYLIEALDQKNITQKRILAKMRHQIT